jgi:hypothetical protein
MSSARPQMFAAIAAASAIAAAQPAAASPDARITNLVAGAREIFALRGNTVVTFDADGREIGRCARFAPPPPERPAPLAAGTVDADEALHLAGLPDDDLDTPEAEEALADEGLAPRRRRARTGPDDTAIVARALAASPAHDEAWIATSDGLYRLRHRTCTRAGLPGRDAVAVAAAGDAVAVASEQLLWRADGGGAFRIAAGMVARPRALAVVDGEHTLVATDDAIVEIGPYGASRAVFDRGSDALAVCGGVAMAFAGDGVWTWSGDDPPQRVGDRPLARTLTCGAGREAGFVAAGGGLYTSRDGVVWRDRRAAPGRPIAAAAVVADRIWLAVDDQVIALRDAAPAPPRPVGPLPAPLPALPPVATGGMAGSTIPWPQLTLVFAGQRTPLRSGWSLVVLVAFRFGRAAAAGADRRHLAAELIRRDAGLAAQELELEIPTDDDPSRAARLRATRQEREALR